MALSEEAHALRRVCAALDQQCRAAVTRAQFKDDLIREMRRQLKQAKAKVRKLANFMVYVFRDQVFRLQNQQEILAKRRNINFRSIYFGAAVPQCVCGLIIRSIG